MRTLFYRLDVNQDGKLTEEDFILLADRSVEVKGLTGQAVQEAKDFFTNDVWRNFLKPVDSDEATPESFLARLKQAGKANILSTKFGIYDRFFTDQDQNKDQVLSLGEFIKYFHVFGISEGEAREAFHAIDKNHDQHMTMEEFLAAKNNFFTLEVPNKSGDLFYGHLVE